MSKKNESLYIVMPAYNEEDTIENTIKQWYPILSLGNTESRLVIVNDGSKDITLSILNRLSLDYPKLVVLDKPNSGHGPTVLYAYRYALSKKADWIFQTDSDGQTLPEEFQQFWDCKDSYDMVIGCRLTRTDGVFRLITTRSLRLLILIIFGVYVKDANLAYRLMQHNALEDCLKYISQDYFLANVMLSIVFAKKRKKICWIPTTVIPRQGGGKLYICSTDYKNRFSCLA